MITREDAERGFLSAFLHDNGILGTSHLDPEMFTTYRNIYSAAVKLSAKGIVKKTDLLVVAGPDQRSLVSDLDVYSSAGWEAFHKVIFDRWGQDQVNSASRRALESTFPASTEILEQALMSVAMREGGARTVTAGDLLPDFLERTIARQKAGGKIPGIACGMHTIDTSILGFGEGQFILIGGRPSDGKSALGWQFARHIAKERMVGWIAMEDSAEELMTRGLAAEAGIDSRAILMGSFFGDESRKLRDGIVRFEKIKENLLIHEKPGMKLTQLHSEIRSMVRRGCKAIFVDYMQLPVVIGNGTKHEKVSEVSVTTKALGRELKVPIIAMAQLKRPEGNDRAPNLNDPQHSDQLSQDADTCLFLWHRKDKEGKANGSCIVIAKAKNGATRNVEIDFNRPTLTFTEREK